MRRRNGFTIIEMILTLMIISVLLPLEIQAFRFFVKQDYFKDDLQDEINLAQLRRVLNVCYGKKIENTTLFCTYKEEESEIRFDGNKCYLTPGTWIFLTEIDDLKWFNEEGHIQLEYCRGNQCRKVTLAYE